MEGILNEKPDIVAMQEVNQTAGTELMDLEMLEGQYPIPGCMPICRDNHAAVVANRLRQAGIECYWVWLPIKLGYDKYDEGVAEWQKNGEGEYIRADIPSRWDPIKTFEPKDCYEFEEKLVKYFNDGSILDPIKQLWYAWDYFENVNNVFEGKKTTEVIDDEENLEET